MLGMMAVCTQVYTKAPISTTILTPHTLLATQQDLSLDQRACLKFPYVTLTSGVHTMMQSVQFNTLHVHSPKAKFKPALTGTSPKMKIMRPNDTKS